MEIKHGKAQLSNTEMSYLHCGVSEPNEHKPVMILLHGFPENSWSWEYYLNALGEQYSVYAPDLPGYNASIGLGGTEQYTLENLIATLVEFIECVNGGQKIVLVAHDWGGVIAWPLAAFHANLIEKFIVMNAAHPSTFTREMASNTRQQKRSDYITDLISEDAYNIVTANDYYRLRRLYGGWFEKLSEQQQKMFIQQWSSETSMQNTFAYYKCMPNLVTTRTKAKIDIKLPNIRIEVPTLMLWGMKDTAFVPEVLNGVDQWVENLKLVKFNDADHWLHHQLPRKVLANINTFLQKG